MKPMSAAPDPITHESFKAMLPVGYLLHEVAKLMKRRFEEETRIYDLTLAQFRILAEVWRSPGATQAALAAAIDSDPMTVSGVLDRLEKRGLLERTPNPQDSRAKVARITPAGETMVGEVRKTGLVIYEDAMRGIGKADQKILAEALGCIRDNLNAMNSVKEDA
jgi:DNA-binding MarR family transcriptional regulator